MCQCPQYSAVSSESQETWGCSGLVAMLRSWTSPFQSTSASVLHACLRWTTAQTWLEWNAASLAGVPSCRQVLVIKGIAHNIEHVRCQQDPCLKCCSRHLHGAQTAVEFVGVSELSLLSSSRHFAGRGCTYLLPSLGHAAEQCRMPGGLCKQQRDHHRFDDVRCWKL